MKRRRKAFAKRRAQPQTPPVSQTVPQITQSRRHAPTERIDTRSWYRIENSISTGSTAVYIYDEIGFWGVSASDFMDALRSIGTGRIELHLNSPGGDVFDGIAIYNCLRAHAARVDVVVDSLAASAASVIAQAGDTVTMMPGSQMMIHDASGLCMGNAEDMIEMGKMLDQQSDNIAGIYAQAAGGTREEWRARMKAETWYMADEAVAAGLADAVQTDSADGEPDPAPARTPAARAFAAHAPAPAAPALAPEAGADVAPSEPAPERVPDFSAISIIDVFAQAVAERDAPPPPDPVAQAWDFGSISALVAEAARSAPALPPRPAPAATADPVIHFDPVDFRVNLMKELVLS